MGRPICSQNGRALLVPSDYYKCRGVTLQESKKCIVIGKVCWDMSITICHALDNSFFLMHYNWWGKSLQSVTHPEDKCVNALQEHYNLSYHGVTYDYNC